MKVNSDVLKNADVIVDIITKAGYQAYFIGGCIRNHLLNTESKDIDIVSSAGIAQLQKCFPHGRIVGQVFPILLVKEQGIDYQLVSFRSDEKDFEKARAEDALKRDFTVNSIYYDPIEKKMIDLVKGQKDIDAKLIRFNGSPVDRINEDPHRMIRAIRLAIECEFEIEEHSFEAIRKQAIKIRTTSQERLVMELDKIWFSKNPEKGLRLLDKAGLLTWILPEVADQKNVGQPIDAHPEGDCFEHTCLCLRFMQRPASRYLTWATVLHDIGKPVTKIKGKRITFPDHAKVGAEMAVKRLSFLKTDNDLIRQVGNMIEHHGQFGKIGKMKKSTFKRIMARSTFEDELDLHYADKMAGNKKTEKNKQAREWARTLAGEQNSLEKAFQIINGHDLNKLGLLPGPTYKVILKSVHDAYLEGLIENKTEAKTMAQKMIDDINLSQQS